MAHTDDSGAPCDRHPPRAEDLVGPATLGTTCFAALHDLASGLQAVGAAVDELDATVGADPRLRPLVDAAVEASANATTMFVAMRNMIRDPGRRRQPVALAVLVRRATQHAATKTTIGSVAACQVVVAVPIVAQVLATLIDAGAGGGGQGQAEIGAVFDGTDVAIEVQPAAVTEPPAEIGATLAIAAHAVEAQGGSVRCGARDGRARYTVRLPVAAG